jgi:uncharacterized membrane protein
MSGSDVVAWCDRLAVALCAVTGLGVAWVLVLPAVVDPGVPGVVVALLVSFALCVSHSAATKGWRPALRFTAISAVISWCLEFVGCNFGWWFGDYGYTDALGPRLGNVPLLVVCCWEVLIYPALLIVDGLAGAATRRGPRWFGQAVLASVATGIVTTSWDLLGDPLAVHEGWWAWDHGGSYLPDVGGGVPISNFLLGGWLGAVTLISLTYRLLAGPGRAVPGPGAPPLFAVALFTAWLFMPLYESLHVGLTESAFIGVMAMGPVLLVAWTARLRAGRTS